MSGCRGDLTGKLEAELAQLAEINLVASLQLDDHVLLHTDPKDVYKRQAEHATRRRFLTKNYNKRNSYGKGDYI